MNDVVSSVLPAVGGAAGLAFLVYMGAMLWYEKKRVEAMEALRRDVRELRGLLIGRRKL